MRRAIQRLSIARCVKNRFGSTNEIGRLRDEVRAACRGGESIAAFLSQRGRSCRLSVVPTLEAVPLLVEIQALTSPTSFACPAHGQRSDFWPLLLIVAVLARRLA